MALISRILSPQLITKVCRTDVFHLSNNFSKIDVSRTFLSSVVASKKCLSCPSTNFSTSVFVCWKLQIPYKNSKKKKSDANGMLFTSKPDVIRTTDDERTICYEIKTDETVDEAITKNRKKKISKSDYRKKQENEITNIKVRNKAFESNEDALIIKYVNEHGCKEKVFRFLLEHLNRDGDWKLLRNRYYRIKDNPENKINQNNLIFWSK